MEGKRVKHILLSAIGLALFSATLALAQTPTGDQAPAQPKAPAAAKKDLTPEEIIRAFSAKETEFYEAWKEYTYHQTADVSILDVNGMPKRERMTIISDVVFKDNGVREVRVVRRAGNLQSVIFTLKDEEVINNLQPFALTDKELPLYNLTFEGKHQIDELNCYVFSVKPKTMEKNRLYFEGKIWVDDQDLQIVRTVGKPVPQKKNEQFPDFETIRQMIDEKYWFPVWTHADSKLQFARDSVHIEETITYEKYKHFGSKATIKFGDPTKP
jgi:hypothetical protein